MRRLTTLLLVLCTLAVAFMGFHVAAPFSEARRLATEKAGFCKPPSPLATPPEGASFAGLTAWSKNSLAEAWQDGMPFVLAGIVLLAVLLRLVAPDDDRRRLRGAVLLFLAYLFLLPVDGYLILTSSADLTSYGYLRFVALTCEQGAAATLGAIFLFDVVFRATGARVPPILRDLLVAAAYAGIVFNLLIHWGVNPSALITTSAVMTALIGFSFQDTLGNVMGGLAIQLEDSIGPGDWIKVGDLTGKVKEVRWRQTTIETRNWDTAVIPNSVLMKGQVLVLGRRSGRAAQHRQWVFFQVDFKHSPTTVIGTVSDALHAAPIDHVAREPRPNCIVYEFKESAVLYAVRYWLTDLAEDDPTDSAIRARIYFALQRAGISLALPSREIHMTTQDEATRARDATADREHRLGALRSVQIFSILTEDERMALCPHLVYAPFTKGEVMTRQGAEAHWLYLIIRGKATVSVTIESGESRFVASLKDGDFFGEMSLLTGEPRSANVIADTDVECWRVDRVGFREIIQRRPEIASELSRILATRRLQLDAVRGKTETRGLAAEQQHLLSKITAFFGL